MIAQHLAQRPMQHMRRAVVAADALTAQHFDGRTQAIAYGNGSFFHVHMVHDQALFRFLGVGDGHLHVGGVHDAGVAHLAALFGIERRLVAYDAAIFAGGKVLDALSVLDERPHGGIRFILV